MIRKMTSRLALATVLMAAAATGVMAQTAQPERREVGNLVFDGIPQIPASLKPQLQRYRNARGAGFAGFMADGSILISTRFGETSQLHRVAAPGADTHGTVTKDSAAADTSQPPRPARGRPGGIADGRLNGNLNDRLNKDAMAEPFLDVYDLHL